jgi:hypothetical protein
MADRTNINRRGRLFPRTEGRCDTTDVIFTRSCTAVRANCPPTAINNRRIRRDLQKVTGKYGADRVESAPAPL